MLPLSPSFFLIMNTPPSKLSHLWQTTTQRLTNFYRSKAFNAMLWVLIGNGGYQVIRFASNLILARLLFPEAFGIMAIVTAIIIGLGQISDVGLREGVINSDRAHDARFMQTAWTLQVLKALVVALLTLAIAWPAAHFYGEDLLLPVIAVTAITMLMQGFRSIALLAYDKRMDLKTQVKCDMFTQIVSVAVIIGWAMIWPSVWALVAGHLVASILEIFLSYRLFKGHFSRFTWDKETVSGMFHFGKWILISSTVSFISLQGSTLIMGGFLSLAELGKYSFAAGLAGMSTLLAYDLSRRVLHPHFRESFDTHNDYRTVRNYRLLFNLGFTCICITFAVFGDKLIRFLYDDRYIEAGWMLQILAVGQIGIALNGTLMPFLIAKGDSFSQMTTSFARASLMVLFIIIGGTFFGSLGVIIGYTLSHLLVHPVMIILAARHGYNCALDDILIMLFSIAFILFIWSMSDSAIVTKLASLGWIS